MTSVDNKKPNLKRKRDDDSGSKVQGKLHHGAREARKAAKKAKSFETQKIVKKLKVLRVKDSSASEISDLEAQLEILKDLDPEPFGNTALKTKLKKDRTLGQDEHVLAAISAELEANLVTPAIPGSAAAKVQAHILSSKNLAAEVATVVQNLKNALNPPAKTEQADDEQEEEDIDVPPWESAKLQSSIKKLSISREEDGERLPSDPSTSRDELEDREVMDEDDEEIDDGGWESGSLDGGVESDKDFDDGDSSGDEDVQRPSNKAKVRPTQSSKSSKPTTTSSSSTFLPSLSVGFTRGDSDASDVDEEEVSAADGGARKNRRGQRARRAIWEKKFGRNANHVKKQQEQEPKASQKGRRPQGRSNQLSGGRPQGKIPSGSNLVELAQNRTIPADKTRKEDKPLHPSWEAKKRLKEKQNAGIVPSQGKKITFD